MSTRKFRERNIRNLTRVGRTSLAVTLPKEFVTKLGWKERQKIVVKKVRGGLLITDWKKR